MRPKRVRRSRPEVLGIARAHFDQVAIVAGDMMHFEHFWQSASALAMLWSDEASSLRTATNASRPRPSASGFTCAP